MKETISRRAMWNEAGKAGLVLGIIPIVYLLLSALLAKLSGGAAVAFLLSILKFLLWVVKFGGCIYLMSYFMKALVKKYDGVDNRKTFNFGMMTAALSALIVAAYSLAQSLIIDPAELREAMETAMSSYSSMLDSNSMAVMDNMMNNLPQINFFANLIYCFLFGTVVSALFSRNIPPQDPFANYNKPDTDQQ